MLGIPFPHGNFMRLRPIAASEQDGSQAMSQRAFLDMHLWSRLYEENQAERAGESDDVWPEVVSDYSLDDSTQEKLENSPRRVLSEAFLILALAGLAAVAASFLVPALS
jgi:hypothetical protein